MLTDLELSRFDAIVVSSEVGYEKPAPEIFKIALGIKSNLIREISWKFSIELLNVVVFCLSDQIGVKASRAVHVGDDEPADKAGANAIGLECWYAEYFSFLIHVLAMLSLQFVKMRLDWIADNFFIFSAVTFLGCGVRM
jgi:hypothetical protein